MNPAVQFFLLPTSPILSLVLGAVGLTFLSSFSKETLRYAQFLVALLSIIGSLVATVYLWDLAVVDPMTPLPTVAWIKAFQASFILNRITLTFFFAVGVFLFLSFLFHWDFLSEDRAFGEVAALLLFVASGMMFLISSNSLLIVFLGLELLSLPTYVLIGSLSRESTAPEAALKYFLFGALGSVFLTLAIAFVYAQFGTLNISDLSERIAVSGLEIDRANIFLFTGLCLFMVAAGFKIGLVPFHMWLPDAYEGAPTPITGFMGSAIKLTGFALLVKLLWGVFLSVTPQWTFVLEVLAVTSMFVGNIAALKQTNLKRLFAYSSIAHVGYLALAVCCVTVTKTNVEPLCFYLFVYGLMFLGIFGIIQFFEKISGSTDLESISGYGFKYPLLSFCFLILTLSAAGIPPTAGFLAKYFVFFGAVQMQKTLPVVLALISSAIGLGYYLRVVVVLYMREARAEHKAASLPLTLLLGVVICTLSMFILSFYPMFLGAMD